MWQQIQNETILKEHLSKTNHMPNKNKCRLCSEDFENAITLKDHLQSNHSFDCESCDYIGIGEETMIDHILEKHAKPDNNGTYSCDECTFQTSEKSTYGDHFKINHGSKSDVKNVEQINKLENELRQTRNNLGRLETMYHEALEESNNLKSEYEAKLIGANDNLAVIKAENEALSEKIDVLFKLSKSRENSF